MDGLMEIDAEWAWWTVALLLAAIEVVVPKPALLWIAAAAFLTGVFTALLPIAPWWQCLLFVELALILTFAVRRAFRDWRERAGSAKDRGDHAR